MQVQVNHILHPSSTHSTDSTASMTYEAEAKKIKFKPMFEIDNPFRAPYQLLHRSTGLSPWPRKGLPPGKLGAKLQAQF